MTSRLSVLRKAKPSDVRLKPFPHLAITNCLDADLYSELSRTYPSDRLIAELNRERVPEGLAGQNIRTDISAVATSVNIFCYHASLGCDLIPALKTSRFNIGLISQLV